MPALVIDASLEELYLISLGDHLTRRNQTTVESARDLAALREAGYKPADIANKVGLSTTYVSGLLRLLDKGEDRLVDAVQKNEIPIKIAIEISSLSDAAMQKSLAEAYANGLRGRDFSRAKRIIEQRRTLGKGLRGRGGGSKVRSREDVLRQFKDEAARRQSLVRKVRLCEHDLQFVVTALKDLLVDKVFADLLDAEKLADAPKPLAEAIRSR